MIRAINFVRPLFKGKANFFWIIKNYCVILINTFKLFAIQFFYSPTNSPWNVINSSQALWRGCWNFLPFSSASWLITNYFSQLTPAAYNCSQWKLSLFCVHSSFSSLILWWARNWKMNKWICKLNQRINPATLQTHPLRGRGTIFAFHDSCVL